ncbi:XapX domain-containing protein [Salibacterium sp. K-3]
MKELMLSLVAGMIIGIVFKFLRLPLPAPPVLAGVIGVAGVYFGGVIVDWFYKTLA